MESNATFVREKMLQARRLIQNVLPVGFSAHSWFLCAAVQRTRWRQKQIWHSVHIMTCITAAIQEAQFLTRDRRQLTYNGAAFAALQHSVLLSMFSVLGMPCWHHHGHGDKRFLDLMRICTVWGIASSTPNVFM